MTMRRVFAGWMIAMSEVLFGEPVDAQRGRKAGAFAAHHVGKAAKGEAKYHFDRATERTHPLLQAVLTKSQVEVAFAREVEQDAEGADGDPEVEVRVGEK